MFDADPDDVLRQAEERWTAGIIECRTYRAHWWRGLTALQGEDGIYTVTERCRRCNKERWVFMSQSGHLLSRWRPVHLRGYGVDRGTGRVGEDARAALRIKMMFGDLPTRRAPRPERLTEIEE